MRTIAFALLLAGSAATAQVRPMPSYDDGTRPGTYPYVDTSASTVGMRARAQALAERAADLDCAGPCGGKAALTRCRRARIAADRRAQGDADAQAAYGERAADMQARIAACQAGDPDACW